jgi:isopentenyl-diphosphate delta-isomerase
MSECKPSHAEADASRAAWRADEQVIAVDEGDNELGLVSRTAAHGRDSILHRAFMTILIDDEGRLLLCRRSAHKRLWPLVWADSCAGHPRPGEDTQAAAERRLTEELGCTTPLAWVGRFVYRTQWGDAGFEHELCHVFVGRLCEVVPDPAEVAEVGLFRLADLAIQMTEQPDDFAPWLIECLHAIPPSAFALPR